MGISFAAMISMITTQHKEGKSIQQQLASGSLKYGILQTLRNPNNCICQFNSLPPTPHTIDTTKTTSGGDGDEIDLGEFRSGCASDDDNILVRQGEKIKGGAGLGAKSVKVSQIIETGTPNEFKGDLQVAYQSQGLVRTLRTLTIPVLFTVDPTVGTEDARPISDCGVKTDVSTRLADLDNRITDLEDKIAIFDPTKQDQQCTPDFNAVTQNLADEGYTEARCDSGENQIGHKSSVFKFAAAGGCVSATVIRMKCQTLPPCSQLDKCQGGSRRMAYWNREGRKCVWMTLHCRKIGIDCKSSDKTKSRQAKRWTYYSGNYGPHSNQCHSRSPREPNATKQALRILNGD